MLFADLCDGRGIGFDQPAAQLPWVGFRDDSKEPARGRLDAVQELVRAMRPGARTVPVASPHRSPHQAFPNERRLKNGVVIGRVVIDFP